MVDHVGHILNEIAINLEVVNITVSATKTISFDNVTGPRKSPSLQITKF